MGFNAATYASFDFGGNKTAQGYFFGSYITFADLSGGNFSFNYNPESLNSRRTRGGPLTLNPISRSFNLSFNSDNRQWWVLYTGVYSSSGDNARSQEVYANIEFKVTPTLTVQIGPDISKTNSNAQWVSAFTDPTANETFGKRYVFANLEQTTFATDIRADWIISPTLSFQVYMQPLIVSGKYTNFKALQKPRSFDFLNYGENGSTITKILSSAGDVAAYSIDADGSGPSAAYTIGNLDFNYLSLRGSAVLRWEYLPGSALFLVWTQNRQDVEPNGEFNLRHSMNSLFDVKPDNIFMLKITYWLGM